MNRVKIRLQRQGNLLKVEQIRENHVTNNNTLRGEVTEFSQKSRKRMIEMFARMDLKRATRKALLFVTLTYEWRMVDYDVAKRDLKVFIERYQERFPKCWIVWRMETQKTGSIHFHLIVGDSGYWYVKDMQKAWNEVYGGTSKNSLDLSVVKSPKQTMYYVSKYMAKPPESHLRVFKREFIPLLATIAAVPRGTELADALFLMGLSMFHIFSQSNWKTGRWWGLYGRKYVPFAPLMVITKVLSVFNFKMGVAHLCSRYANFHQNFTIFDDDTLSLWDIFLRKSGEKIGNSIARNREREAQIEKRLQRHEKLVESWEKARAMRKAERDHYFWLASVLANGTSRKYGLGW